MWGKSNRLYISVSSNLCLYRYICLLSFDYFFSLLLFVHKGGVPFEHGGLQDQIPKLISCSTKTVSVSQLALLNMVAWLKP